MKKLSLISVALLLCACNTIPQPQTVEAKVAEKGAAAVVAATTATKAVADQAAAQAALASDAALTSLALQMQALSDKRNLLGARDMYVLRMARLTAKLQTEDGLNLNFKAYRAPTLGATVSPDGSIRVHSGLMDILSDSELLALLAREISHVKSDAALARLRAAYLAYAAGKSGSAPVASLDGLADAELLAIGEALGKYPFAASTELAADDYSQAFMLKRRADAKALERALRKLAAKGERNSAALFYPDAKVRADRVRGLAGKK